MPDQPKLCMYKKKYKKMLLLMTAASMCMPFTANAADKYEVDVINNLAGIGEISISLDEYELGSDGTEQKPQTNTVISPGMTVSQIARITNNANPAWIRAKAGYAGPEGLEGFSDEHLAIASDKWKRCGDYYYYMEPLKQGESVDFLKEVTVPPEWGNKYAGKEFKITVIVDAVQEDNFTPDFSEEEPWFGTVIEERVQTSSETPVTSNPDKKPFSVEFEGGADGFVLIGDDFFSNFGVSMPGDTLKDSVKVGSKYKDKVNIYFRTEEISDGSLADKINLVISNNNGTIYDGPLSGTLEEVKLGEYSNGDLSELKYTLNIPKELGNEYALSKAKAKWIFRAEVPGSPDSPQVTPTPEDKPGEKPEDKPSDKPEEKPGEKPEEKPEEKPDSDTKKNTGGSTRGGYSGGGSGSGNTNSRSNGTPGGNTNGNTETRQTIPQGNDVPFETEYPQDNTGGVELQGGQAWNVPGSIDNPDEMFEPEAPEIERREGEKNPPASQGVRGMAKTGEDNLVYILPALMLVSLASMCIVLAYNKKAKA